MEINSAKIQIAKIAAGNGYKELNRQNYSMTFQKGEGIERIVINVYWKKAGNLFTVQSALNHPKKGRKQYNRININLEMLEKIFDNPRLHTKELGVKGYFKK